MLHLLAGIVDLNKAKHVKNDRWKISACSMASNKSVGLVYVKRWKKRNKTIFDWWKIVTSFGTVLVDIRVSG